VILFGARFYQERGILSKRPMRIEDVLEGIRTQLEQVDSALLAHLESDVALIPAIGSYLARGGGKRVRPILVLLTAKLCVYEGARYITHSCVVEFIHTATLLHDDVVDSSQLRRGAPSANARWGNEASVLVGDYLFAKSLWLMAADQDPRIIQVISDATVYLSEGEVLQLVNEFNLAATEESYLDVIYRKTAALIASCCQIGAILGNAPPEREQALGEFGRNVGYAFQLVDDALDYTAKSERLGKPVGKDLAEGNVTLPLIYLYRLADEGEKHLIRELFFESNGSPQGRLQRILELMKKYRAIEYTMGQARDYVGRAKAILRKFETSYYQQALLSLADYIVERDQ
jgi:octaprenyl-diphosphate synthase